MLKNVRRTSSETQPVVDSPGGQSYVDALGGLTLRGLGVVQGVLLTVLLPPDQRGQVALVMSAMIVVAQLAPLGADHALAVSGGRPSFKDTSPRLRMVMVLVAALLFLVVARGRSWPTTSNQLTALWALAAVAAPVGVVIVADLQRKGQHLRRIVAQSVPLVLGCVGLATLAVTDRLTSSTALAALAGAAIAALPLRLTLGASAAEPVRRKPAPDFNRTALSYLAVHVPAMSIQRADQIVLAIVSTMSQAGFYALAASIAFLQTAVTEQVLKREVSSGRASTREAWRWAAISYLVSLVLLVATSYILPDYADALVPGLVLCTGWFVHFAAYRRQLLTVTANRSSTPALVAVGHVVGTIVLGSRYGATGAATAFLIINALWLVVVLRGDRG